MHWSNIFATISLIVVIVVVFLLQKYLKSPIIDNVKEPLINFSYDIKFDPFPSFVNLENKYLCTGDNLRKCKVDNPLSCIGCQSLIASCVHFKENTVYIDANNVKYNIPKNEDLNEGYCLTILQIEKFCNVYHGDLTLVQLTPDSSDTMLICNCRNPGLIGNLSLMGSCTNVFMCNGEIDEINKPINEINCICAPNNENIKINNISHCVPKTIENAGDQLTNLIFPSSRTSTQDTKNFNKMIAQNFPTRTLKDPCGVCPVTGKQIPNHATIFSPQGTACTISYDNSGSSMYFGIPIRRSPTERLLDGDHGPDAILGVYWHSLMIYSYLENYIQRFVFSFGYVGNEEFYSILKLDRLKNYAISVDDLLLGNNFPIPPTANNPSAICEMMWPSYNCTWSISNNSLLVSVPNVHMITPPPRAILNKIVQWKNDNLSEAFLWGRETWKNMIKLNSWLTSGIETPLPHIKVSEEYFLNPFASDIKFMALAIEYKPGDTYYINFLTTGNIDHWKELTSKMTNV